METKIPDFLLEMSKQMREQPNRSTAHPFWQVRCKRYVVTEEGYNDHHWILADSEGEFYRSDTQSSLDAAEYLSENYSEWFAARVSDFRDDNDDISDIDLFCDGFDFDYDCLPLDVNKISVQEIEEVVSTHLTQDNAEWFIKRKQHDYPKLYTWVESAYWSPQLKQLQDWIISLSEDKAT